MNTYVLDVLHKYRRRGILVDTNVALLYVVGSIDISLIERNKRTATFSVGDFETLSAFVDFFRVLYSTPYILSELSNLLPARFHSGLIPYIENSVEQFESAHILSKQKSFLSLGLTDSSILDAASKGVLVVSDDALVVGTLRETGRDAVAISEILMN